MVRRLLSALFVSIAIWGGWILGQGEESGRDAEIEQLKSRVSELEGDESIPEATRNSEVSSLQQAIAFLEKASEFEATEGEYKEALANGARDINRMQAEETALEESLKESRVPPNLTKDSDMSLIESAISQEQVTLTDARSELSSISASIAENKASPTTIRDRLIAVRAEIVEVESMLSKEEAKNDQAEPTTKQVVLKAQRDSLLAESSMLEQESLSYEIRMAKSGAAKALAEKRVEVVYDRIGSLQNLANVRLVSEVDRAEALFRRVQQLAPEADDSVAKLISQLEVLIKETRNISTKLESIATRLQEREALLRSITADFDSVQQQTEVGGLQGTFAGVLLEKRRTLPGALEERQLIRQIRQDLTAAQRSLYYLESHVNDDTEQVVEDAAQMAGQGSEETEKLREEAGELRDTRDQLSQDLIANFRRLVRELGELDLIEQQIDQESAKYRDFLAEQLFWVRSSPVINGDSFKGVPSAFGWILGPERWKEFAQQIAVIPLWYHVLLLTLVAALFAGRRKFHEELEKAGKRTRQISTDKYANTVTAFFMTIFLALPLPLLLAGLGVGLRNHPEATEWGFALGTASLNIGLFLMFAFFTREIAREKGLGDYHFKWERSRRERVYLLFRRLLPIYIPLSLIVCLVQVGSNTDFFDSLGRLAAIFGSLAVGAVFVYFSRTREEDETGSERSKIPFFSSKAIFWLNIVVTTGLVVLLLIGYVVTALLLFGQLQLTVIVIYMAFVVHAMVLRWFEIKERRLALAEAIARRRKRLEAAAAEEDDEPNESEETLVIEAEKEQRLDLVEVGEQTRNVIGFLVGVGLLIVLWYVWTELVPVLKVLDNVQIIGELSIADLAVIVLVIAVTISITKNLPGLLEMLVLRRLDVIPGTRAAIFTLSKYVVIATGAIVLFRYIGVDWSQFGWIAAALSVGLGFGLQEVVANFICGIILLFERPIRVGDVVSVAGVSGAVSKIQMRATTIVNFDREEFVVPNKEFITGSLINMTLSSPINRLMIPVGVAYGSDTEEVLRILSEVAHSVEDVMEDPSPVITFEAFGDSSLDFMIRVFLPSRENRLGVITELHREINDRFAEAGIEIPFPQRDLHLRSIDEDVKFGKGEA
ncbi:MAG: mechanosensitive ion channel [Verrucomicrobiales bacterium]|nr:mechanosensitive ion channel [Verrucomicrobiales bacterium]